MTPEEDTMETASIVNMVQRDSRQPTPEVGMGATRLMWTDRHAYTVIEVSRNGKRCVVQRDKATRTDSNGMSDCQTWAYEPDPNGYKATLSLRKDGRWRRVGGTCLFAVGWRDEHFDYSF